MVPYKESHVDVLVAGGGTAGVCAAIAASMSGADVRVIDQNGFFGGTLVSGIVGGFCGIMGAKYAMDDNPEMIIGGVGSMIIDAVREKGGLSALSHSPRFNTYRYNSCILQIVLDELICKHAVTSTLHTYITDACVSNGQVTCVETHSKSGKERIFPKFVIDATGDADIVYMTGGNYRKDAANLQPGSFNFRMGGVDPLGRIPNIPEAAREIARILQEEPDLKLSREDPSFLMAPDYRDVICTFSRIQVDGTDAASLTQAEIAGRREVLPTAEFIRKHFPAFKNAYIAGLASHIGIRETRVIEGEGVLTEEDVISGRIRPDAIGRCAWPVERHVNGKTKSEVISLKNGDYYSIPFDIMIPKNFANLLVVGRAASADKSANASIRVFGPCAAMGHAAGAASHIFVKENLSSVKDINIEKLRGLIASQGALL
ncbi:MAG: FAD-dependent oxidoreductase [Clostridiales Family XIII bacterium]|jgi:hypothetical protein|nr:FAD-dependent oxidoreductase [Clostridiales Family XIII bacterium]